MRIICKSADVKEEVAYKDLEIPKHLALLSTGILEPDAIVSTDLDISKTLYLLDCCQVLQSGLLKPMESPYLDDLLKQFGSKILNSISENAKDFASILNLLDTLGWALFTRGINLALTEKCSQVKIDEIQQIFQWIHVQDLATRKDSLGFANIMSLYFRKDETTTKKK